MVVDAFHREGWLLCQNRGACCVGILRASKDLLWSHVAMFTTMRCDEQWDVHILMPENSAARQRTNLRALIG